MPKAFAGPRTFTVSVTIGHEDLHTATATIVIDADDIYQAGIDAQVRYLARKAEMMAGLREDTVLR